MELNLKDENGDSILVVEGPIETDRNHPNEGFYKVTMPNTGFGTGTARYLTRDQMFQIAWAFTGEK